MLEQKWMTLNKEPIEDVVKEVDGLLAEGDRIVHIGTDAQKMDKMIEFVTCIVVHKERKGGRVFYCRTKKTKQDVQSLRQKLFTEAWMSVETAMELEAALPDQCHITVHLDVNPDEKWASNRHINEVVGMVMGQGYEVLVKPESWCASHCADHAVKHKNHRELRKGQAWKRRS
jgi:predicted RNase H-related nuclease YkuK (DUF458 family)